MSTESNITRADKLFIGVDRDLSYRCYTTPANQFCRDMVGVPLRWVLRKQVDGADPYLKQGPIKLTKTIGAGISIIGVFNATPASNTQEVIVRIDDTDTLSLKAGDYVMSLKDDTPGAEDAISTGTVVLLKQAAD